MTPTVLSSSKLVPDLMHISMPELKKKEGYNNLPALQDRKRREKASSCCLKGGQMPCSCWLWLLLSVQALFSLDYPPSHPSLHQWVTTSSLGSLCLTMICLWLPPLPHPPLLYFRLCDGFGKGCSDWASNGATSPKTPVSSSDLCPPIIHIHPIWIKDLLCQAQALLCRGLAPLLLPTSRNWPIPNSLLLSISNLL